MNNTDHVMLDIETLSTEKNAAVVAIAAVKFSLRDNELGEEIFIPIKLDEYEKRTYKNKFHVSMDTLYWWLTRVNRSVCRDVFDEQSGQTIKAAATELVTFMQDAQYVWAYSPSFDVVICQNLCRVANASWPMSYKQELDLRTLVTLYKRLYPSDYHAISMRATQQAKVHCTGKDHHPLYDAYKQVFILQSMKDKVNLFQD